MSRWNKQPKPDWVLAIDRACEHASQNRVAQKLGYSSATISGIRRGTYAGSYDGVERAARGVLMNGKVDCPQLGQIGADRCDAYQRNVAKKSFSNKLNRRMWRACQRCPRFQKEN